MKQERKDEWDVEIAISRAGAARARLRLDALEQYRDRLAGLSSAPEQIARQLIVDEDRLDDLVALDEELTDARAEHEEAQRRRRLLIGLRKTREHATTGEDA